MNGLMRSIFYETLDSIKISVLLLLIIGAVLLATGNESLLLAFSVAVPPVWSALMFSSLRKEDMSRWGKYKLTFPVKRREIVQSQYIAHVAGSLFGVLVSTVFMGGTVLIHGNRYFYYGFRDAVTLIAGGAMIALMMGAISYPLYYLWGSERAELILAVGILGSAGVILALTGLANYLSDGPVTDAEYYMNLIVDMVITSVMYGASYILSIRLFQKKEY